MPIKRMSIRDVKVRRVNAPKGFKIDRATIIDGRGVVITSFRKRKPSKAPRFKKRRKKR